MKKFLLVVLCISLSFAPARQGKSTSTNNKSLLRIVKEIESIEENCLAMEAIRKKKHEIWIKAFLDSLAMAESTNVWDTTNTLGYVGKYQFGLAARQTVGVKHFTVYDFRKNPMIWPEKEQDSATVKLMKHNHRYLSKYFKEPGDRLTDHMKNPIYINGDTIQITWAGIYAASHLVGPKNVRRFLNTRGGYNYRDANNTAASDYMKKFSHMELGPLM